MSVSRRNFLKRAVKGGAAAAAAACTTVAGAPEPANALQREPKPLAPEAVGLLYDSTLCIGCKACMSACKESNHMPQEVGPDQPWNDTRQWDTPVELSAKTLNVIKVYTDGNATQKDHEKDGFAFLKRQCLHCTDPSCVSVCPVSAMTKDKTSGIVSHNPDACIGCRYCVLSCPFGVPKYDYNDAFGQIHKCQLCKHKLAENQLPGCADVCPTGATLFGKTPDLLAEAKRRTALKPGEYAHYPRGDINGHVGGARDGHEKRVEVAYQSHIYGERELGGTQCLSVSAVPFDKLNLPTNVPEYGYPTLSEGIQHTLYAGMVGPAAVLGGLVYFAHRNTKDQHDPD
ncbi:Fe-S-cluster-containing dehydrogenase component [Azospirillum fermentarium]|uniref:hydrogenase 2 operon protein HybA n=1 Tax=Azospirillum fermentarium TaxID=1233114 RepID=UPI002226FD1E|nr:hydrogenase 2 operon protein HybA [Azospirillum fermentarium]MCW2246698.1 Fe-S-cluster-containing dehydrogenase component [Azospirillum fermentarium]